MRIFAPLILSFASASFVGCGGSSSGETDPDPPAISNLALTPTEIPVGKLTTVSGTVDFSDKNSDVSQLAIDVTLPTGARQSVGKTEVQGAKGKPGGPVAVALFLQPPVAGQYLVDVYLIDAKGHESNHLRTTLTAK
jgi:hypothetical protein